MLKIVGILSSAIIIVLIELKNIRKKWGKREKLSFFISLFLGISLTIVWSLGIEIWNPLDFFSWIYQPIAETYLTYLKNLKNR